jgi:hypothetical protein
MKRARFFGSMIRYGAVATAVLAIAGCGGGGGGGDGVATVDVTADNEDALAHAAAVAVQGGVLLDWTGAQTARARDSALRAQREVAKAVYGPDPQPCDVSGQMLFTWNDRDDNLDLSVGDVLTGQFEACEDIAGEFMTGKAEVTITEISTARGVATASFTNLAVSVPAAQRSVTYDGTGTLSVETSPPSVRIRLSVPGSLKIGAKAPSFGDTITRRSGYVLESVIDSAAGTSTTTAGGDIVSENAGGLVELKTLSAIVQDDSASVPREGVVQLLAKPGKTGSLTVRALNTNQVRIEADYDGDGTVDRSRDHDWSWLL